MTSTIRGRPTCRAPVTRSRNSDLRWPSPLRGFASLHYTDGPCSITTRSFCWSINRNGTYANSSKRLGVDVLVAFDEDCSGIHLRQGGRHCQAGFYTVVRRAVMTFITSLSGYAQMTLADGQTKRNFWSDHNKCCPPESCLTLCFPPAVERTISQCNDSQRPQKKLRSEGKLYCLDDLRLD